MSKQQKLNTTFTLSRATAGGPQAVIATDSTGAWTFFHAMGGELFAVTLTVAATPAGGAE